MAWRNTRKEFYSVGRGGFGQKWEVIAHQKPVRAAHDFDIQIKSGIDWFDLQAKFRFGDIELTLPQLFLNLKSNERFISLGDGTYGILPETWLAQFGPLAELAKETNGRIAIQPRASVLMGSVIPTHANLSADQKFTTLSQLVHN